MRSKVFANGILALAAVFLIALQAKGIWNHHAVFSRTHAWIFYGGFTVLNLALLATLLFAETRIKVGLTLGLLSTAFSLFAADLACLYALERGALSDIHLKAARKAGLPFRETSDLLEELKARGIEPFNFLPVPAVFVLNQKDAKTLVPVAGKSNAMCWGGNEEGNPHVYQSDEHGFNNPAGIWNRGRIDIMITGDSMSHGSHVPREQTYAGFLREKYPGTINLSNRGQGPLQELAVLKEYGRAARPRLVVWAFFEGNDLDDLDNEKRYPSLLAYLRPDHTQNLFQRQKEIDDFYTRTVSNEKNPRPRTWAGLAATGRNALMLRHLRKYFGLLLKTEPDLPMFRGIIGEARDTVRSWGGELCFLYLPSWKRYAPREPFMWLDVCPYREQILGIVREAGVPVIDADEAFKAQPDPLNLFPYRIDGHYRVEGHRAIADAVLQKAAPLLEKRTRGEASTHEPQ